MMPIIETSRLYLRELTPEDTEKLSLVLSNPQSMKYYPKPFTSGDVGRWIAWNIENYSTYGFGLWAVILKENGELIGDCGITMQDIEGTLCPEVGYHIRKEYCLYGYASEAARACVDFCFTKRNMTRVISYMKSDNIPSRRVAEKVGMRYVRNFRKWVRGEEVTEALYEIKANS